MKIQKIAALAAVSMALILGVTGCNNEQEKNQEAYRKLGIKNMASGNYDKAVQSFQKALDASLGKVGPTEIDICYYKAAAQFAQGNYDDAIAIYTALIDYDKENAQAYYLRGSVYLKTKQEEKARGDYDQAVKYAGDDFELYRGIYENMKNSGYEEEAGKYLEAALSRKPQEPSDYAQQGYIYYLLEDYQKARASLDKAIDGEDESALLYLAQVYQAMDQGEQAQALLENYVKNNKGDSKALNTLGMMEMNAGNYEEALKYFQMGSKVKDAINRQEILKNEIAAYEYAGDFAQAKEKMAAYLKEYPGDEEAVRENIFLKSR